MFTNTAFTFCTLLTITAAIQGCGSVDSVDSKDVPTKTAPNPGNPSEGKNKGDQASSGTKVTNTEENKVRTQKEGEDVTVQDIYQRYSVTHLVEKNQSNVSAQFRVRTSRGTTIRLTNSSQISFNGTALQLIDGNAVEAVTDVLSMITFLPFWLLRTGTFYSDTFPGEAAGSFQFKDDLGNIVSTTFKLPNASVDFNERNLNVKRPTQPFTIRGALMDPTSEASCELHSEWSEALGETRELQEKSEISTTRGTREGDKFACTFQLAELQKHEKATGTLELKVEVSQVKKIVDAFERSQEIDTKRIFSRSVETLSN